MSEPELSSSSFAATAALDRYASELAARDLQLDDRKQVDQRLGVVRIVLFLVCLLFLFVALLSESQTPHFIIAGIAFAVFYAIAIYNESVREKIERLHSERKVLRRLIARLDRDWKRLNDHGLTRLLESLKLPSHQREVADDLDLFGENSLFQLVAIVGTCTGATTLARWLAAPAIANVAQGRAAAIQQLSEKRSERLRFYVTAHRVGESTGNPERFVQWAGGVPWLDRHRWLIVWANLSLILTVILLATVFLGALIGGWSVWVKYSLLGLFVLAFANFSLTGVMLGPVHQIFSVAMSSRESVAEYQELVAAAHWTNGLADASEESVLQRVRSQLIENDTSAEPGFRQLEQIASRGSLRQSAATFLLYLPLQAFALWDVRVLKWLENWQQQYGQYVGNWIDALGELESLMSLAALRDEYPDWATPIWTESSQPRQLVGEHIGHPLIPDSARVCNDVSIGPTGTFLLVTGSNMSGKSTLLRSVGLNVALAGSGAPVCAKRFQLPSTQLATSIRVRDNLAEGVSFYMAELRRLRGVVDQARAVQSQQDRVLMFLLDEILQGTNSRERQIAVSQVIQTLVTTGAVGAISTHDLELADDPSLAALATTVHFREQIEMDPVTMTEQMTFDYHMRPGVSPTTNALRLLEIVGLSRSSE